MDKAERRRYFRVNDKISLSYRPIVENEIDHEYRDNVSNIELETIMIVKELNKEVIQALDKLWETNEQVANILSLLNRKMDFLAAELNPMFDRYQNEENITEVDLSACGMAFQAVECFSIGQQLDLNLRLRPSSALLHVLGVVVGCEKLTVNTDQAYRLRVDFVHIGSNGREVLIQHIVKRQSSQLGKRKF